MKAAVVTKPGEIVVKDLPTPQITDDDVLVRVISGSICNATDFHILNGTFEGYHDFYPQVTGHETYGEVVEVGKNVTSLMQGDKILFYSMYGAFCEYVRFTAANQPYALAHHLPPEIAPLCEMFHGSYLGMVYPAQVKPTDRALVVGQGPMGLTTLQLLKTTGVKTIVTLDLLENRCQLSRELGADHSLNCSGLAPQEIVETVRQWVDAFDIAFMCIDVDKSPTLSAFDIAVELLKPGGRLTGLHVAVKNLNHRVNPHPVLSKNIKFRHFLEDVYPQDARASLAVQRGLFNQALDWVRKGDIQMKPLVSRVISLDEVQEGIMLCNQQPGETVKVVVRVSE